MSATLQVIYPASDGTTFDYDYYATSHMKIVGDAIGQFIQSVVVTKGLAGGPDTPPGYHAVATIVFEDDEALGGALAAIGPAVEDIPNFTNVKPDLLIGESIG